MNATICVKKDDLFVSESIIKTGGWETENVKNLMKGVLAYKDAVFVGWFLLKIINSLFSVCRCWLQPWDVHHHGGLHEQGCGGCGCHG